MSTQALAPQVDGRLLYMVPMQLFLVLAQGRSDMDGKTGTL